MATIVKEYEMRVNTDDAQENVKDLNKDIKKTGSDLSGVTDAADKATGGMISGFKGALGAIKKVLLGFKTMRGAIIATGIGALVIVVTSLAAAFAGSEEGQNKFAKIMTVIGALTGNLIDLLADFGETIIKIFENPKESAVAFGKLLKDQIVNRVEGILELIPALGKALKLVFQGEFTEAANVASNNFGKILLGVEDTVGMTEKAINASKRFTEEQIKEGKAAAEVADMRAKADKIERALVVDRSKLESEIALLRLKSRQEEEFSAAERKQALLDAQVLEDSLLDKETEFLELRRDAQIAENTFSRSNKENLTKEAEAIAAVNRQQAARANTARQVQREVNTISKQIEAEDNKIIAAKKRKDAEDAKKEIELEKALADLKIKMRDAEAVTKQEKRDLELIKLQEHYDALILQAEENNVNTDSLKEARDESLKVKQDTFIKEDLDATEAANKIKIDEAKKTADEEIRIAQLVVDQKKALQESNLNNISQGFALLGQIAGKNKAIQAAAIIGESAVGIARTVIAAQAGNAAATAQGVALAVPTLGASVASAAALVTSNNISAGISIAANIAATMKALGGLGEGGSLPSPPKLNSSSVTRPSLGQGGSPNFNIVGQTGTNQLADAIGGQNQKPVKAFVVAADVTSGQSLERNIIEGASL